MKVPTPIVGTLTKEHLAISVGLLFMYQKNKLLQCFFLSFHQVLLIGLLASIVTEPVGKLLAQNAPIQDLETATLYQQGVMRYNRKDLQAAESAFRSTLQRNPNIGIARYYLGNIMLLQNRLDAAVQEYGEALRINPNYGDAYYNLGLALHKQGQSQAAITAYRQALVVDPTMVSAQYNLGLALYEQGQKDEAIATYQQLISIDNSNANAYFNLAGVLQEQKRIPDAIAAYQQTIKLDPNNAVAYNNMASLLISQGQTSVAIATYLDAIRHVPKNAVTYYNLGVTLYNQGDFKTANSALKRARKEYHEHGDIQQAGKVEQLMLQIAQMQKQPAPQIGQMPFPNQIQTNVIDVAKPLAEKPTQPETSAIIKEHPSDAPASVEQPTSLEFRR